MARVYIVTEEEMNSLLDQLKLTSMADHNIFKEDRERPATAAELHRAFHYVVVRWAQAMGFDGYRR